MALGGVWLKVGDEVRGEKIRQEGAVCLGPPNTRVSRGGVIAWAHDASVASRPAENSYGAPFSNDSLPFIGSWARS